MENKKKNYDYSELANKYTLSFDEAQRYFRIGERRMRTLIHENEDADWLLWVGNRHYIKRELFEKYLAKANRL